ncbi:MAG: TolC family protein [Acidobacteriaceae bacterium]|jgi:outer membrane protein|nr:TolC family protein [Acidobacteriaceae bacterium]
MTRLWMLWLTIPACFGQPAVLTLAEAEAEALRRHPGVAAAELTAAAQAETPRQVRSALAPQIGGAASGTGATDRARIAAGQLQNPIIFSRLGMGGNFNQLLYDGGRTKLLAQGAEARARSEKENANTTRAQVLLQVRQAYLNGLRAQAVLRVAEQTVAARELVLEQVTAMTNANLKSGLDLSFAQVAVSEAKLLVAQAENEAQGAAADLAAAMGMREPAAYSLAEPPALAPLPAAVKELLPEALRQRPELAARRLEREAAQRLLAAEGRLTQPTVTAVGAAGVTPLHVAGIEHSYYAAAGVVVNLNFLNGGMFSARRREAELRARAAEQRVQELENRVVRDVTVAWLNVRTAAERRELTEQLRARSVQAFELAQARYELGLSSIVEVSQAQLARTAAELQQAAARYDYLAQRAALAFHLGAEFK